MRVILLDECMSPRILPQLWDLGVDAVHVRDRNMLGVEDHIVWRYAQENGRAVVTINKGDFLKLAKSSKAHSGLVVIPSGGTTHAQFLWLSAALTWISTSNTGNGFLNRYVEVDESGNIVFAEIISSED